MYTLLFRIVTKETALSGKALFSIRTVAEILCKYAWNQTKHNTGTQYKNYCSWISKSFFRASTLGLSLPSSRPKITFWITQMCLPSLLDTKDPTHTLNQTRMIEIFTGLSGSSLTTVVKATDEWTSGSPESSSIWL